MDALLDLTLSELSVKLDRGEVSATDVLDACLARIAETRALATFLWVDEKGARAAARAADERQHNSARLSPLDGVPIALKDNFVTEGVPTTAGSKILEGWVPPYDADASRRLKALGSVIVGKTRMDEFAMGSSNEHSPWAPARNPWDPSRVPGGSSGGSAAAVAARQVFGAFGTDTGGSVRQPAALCGVYGLKPTYGRVSRRGIVAFASSLDQVGPLGRSPRDIAHLLSAVAGFDPGDSTSADIPAPEYARLLDAPIDLRGTRVGLPAEYFAVGLDPEVEDGVRRAIAVLQSAGAELVPISLPHTKFAVSVYYVIAPAEASSNLARYDGVRYGLRIEDRDLHRMIARSRHAGFGAEVKRRIVLGTFVLSAGYYEAYYGKAQRVRTLVRRDFERAFEAVDLIATPTSPIPAFPLGSRLEDPLAMYLADVCTLAVNLAGVPGLSVPAGFTQAGLPIGLQLIGPWFQEPALLRAAEALDRRTDHSRKKPDLARTAVGPKPPE
ncbi:MAG: Asp-tRNA(Asn)/Glu-tRNA(Gln) amidotransferase subunit GatA [Deltaproteobacteria bacterium]|nr:Asp-tRNA(Asn)/Glu-tRNA(Gln) amidotransferase subunit GatA [Deltaproteobacteria bacterium]